MPGVTGPAGPVLHDPIPTAAAAEAPVSGASGSGASASTGAAFGLPMSPGAGPTPDSTASSPITIPVASLAPAIAADEHDRKAHHHRHHQHLAGRGRRAGRKVFSVLAMAFAGAIAVATSVPANALLTEPDAGAPVAESAPAHRAIAADELQTIRGDGKTQLQVTRDDYDSKSLEQVVALSHMRIADTFSNDPKGTIQWPFPVGVPISDDFGPRIAPTAGASTFHEGVDFAPGAGTPIHIIADGVVREVDPYDDNGLGVHVIVDHMIDGQLVSSVYGHMRPGSLQVSQGEHVKVSQVVGLVGNTGVSTGAHLHFEIRINGTDPVDPYAWLEAHAN